MSTAQTVDNLQQARAHHMGSLNLLRVARKNWPEAINWSDEHAQANPIQQAYALDDELAMTGKSMAGAA